MTHSYLNWLLKINMESIAWAVRVKFCSFQLDAHTVVGWTVGRAIQPEADDEDPLVNTELNAITAASIAPLIATIRRRLEPMTDLGLEAGPRLTAVQNKLQVTKQRLREILVKINTCKVTRAYCAQWNREICRLSLAMSVSLIELLHLRNLLASSWADE